MVAPSIWVAAPVLPNTSVAHEGKDLFVRRERKDPSVHDRIAELNLITPHYQHVEGTVLPRRLSPARMPACSKLIPGLRRSWSGMC